MKPHVLDTNIASHVINGDRPAIIAHLAQLPVSSTFISVITEAELCYGLAKCGAPAGLSARVGAFLIRSTVLPWTRDAARAYGYLQAKYERRGVNLSRMDMLIAAHSCAIDAVLVTRDKSFRQLHEDIDVQDWPD